MGNKTKLKDSVQIFFNGPATILIDTLTNKYVDFTIPFKSTTIEQVVYYLKTGKGTKPDFSCLHTLLKIIPKDFLVFNADYQGGINPMFLKNFLKLESLGGDSLRTITLMNNLPKTNFAVLGVGSLGCHIIQHLLLLGAKNFTLIDYDQVESSNINRQILFSPGQIGRQKVDAAAEYIKAFASRPVIHKVNKKISNAASLRKIMALHKVSFLFLTADTPIGKISDICAAANSVDGISWVRINRNGFGPFWSQGNACPNCHYLNSKEKSKKIKAPKLANINYIKGVLNYDISFRVSLLIKEYVNFLSIQDSVKNIYWHVNVPSLGLPILDYERAKKNPNCPCQNR